MRVRTIIDQGTTPALATHARLQFDSVRDRWALLTPERVHWPDDIGLDILRRCDGQATIAAIVANLATEYDAPDDEIRQDVIAFLQDWADQRIVVAGL